MIGLLSKGKEEGRLQRVTSELLNKTYHKNITLIFEKDVEISWIKKGNV